LIPLSNITLVRICVLSILILILGFQFGSAQEIPDPPKLWVADYPDLLTSDEERTLNARLKSFEDSTSNQIIVTVFQNAQGYPVEDFTIRLAEKWLVGQRDRDNGIILAIYLDEKKVRIEVGYGLEDIVPDAIAFQIAQNIIPPYFREGQYFQGIEAGIQALMNATAGKFEGISKKNNQKKDGSDFPFSFLVFIFIIFVLMFRRKRYSSVSSRGWRNTGPFWWGGFGGRSSGGGFGGGGFSGGGGSFGGGGATGSW
jgi:uncharacterized protein